MAARGALIIAQLAWSTGVWLCADPGVAQDASPPAAASTVRPPEVLHRVDAQYPPQALLARQQASVVLLVTVGTDGTVTSASVAESGGDAFDQAALEAVKRWRFLPARQDDTLIVSRIRIPFRFELPAVQALPATSARAPVATAGASGSMPESPAGPGPQPGTQAAIDVTVRGRARPPSRGSSDYELEVGSLAIVPHQNAAEMLKLAPGILLTSEGGDAHAEQVFLRGFDAREGQDIEFTVDGVPVNESGNLHGNGYADTHFIIPEVVDSLRVVEGPFDPRQGNYAVAGSADYHLALAQRGLTAKLSAGNYGSYRQLFSYGPPGASSGTFVAAELYQTEGFGANRQGHRGTFMAQYEGQAGGLQYRLTAAGYSASFHSAGVLREDDVEAGRVGFFGTHDPLQGEDSSRYSIAAEFEIHSGNLVARNLFFAIARPMRLRENPTGFLLDVEEPLQQPHGQRGDLLDLHNSATTLGARGSARFSDSVFAQLQAIELGYYARGDFVAAMQQRIEAATGHPYHTTTQLDSTLADIGLYADADLHIAPWLALRGGIRGDMFTFDVNDECAVQSIGHPSASHPPGDQSCPAQQNFGAYRDPNQRAGTVSSAYMPRASLIVGPIVGLSASLSAGRGVRSIDPGYITQDAKTPFASITAYEAGLQYELGSRHGSGLELGLRSAAFETLVDRDLIFSQTVGRNVLAGATTRIGSANSARLSGAFYDVAANLSYVKASFDDTRLLIPYVPDWVLRGDGALHGDLPWFAAWLGSHPLRAALGTGVTYVAPRPLPYGSRSQAIFTLDGSLSLGFRFIELSLAVQNLLDAKYPLGEYNYASDFHSEPLPTLVPVRHFSAGAPRMIWLSIALNYGAGP